jgi:aminoglycoside phosphotransferase (APT) family kinase protein
MNRQSADTVPVRRGEELPTAFLEEFMRQNFPDAAGPFVIEQFPHGHSNLTYLLRYGDVEAVLRRGPFGNQVKSAHDMGREFRFLSALAPVYPPAPRPMVYRQSSDLGAPFYLMERRRGVILRARLPDGLLIDLDTARRLSTALVDRLADLHGLDHRAAGLADFGKPDGYVARQVAGWTERHAKAWTDDVPSMNRVAAWLANHSPPESGAALIHNDFKYDNLVLDPADLTRVVAVLDWEMATVGDPLMDLGTTLAYWVEAGDPPELVRSAMGPTTLPGTLTRGELVDRYCQRTGRDAANAVFYYAYGLFKVAVIVQQIYARYVRGHTADARFARMNELVAVLASQADRAIDTRRL